MPATLELAKRATSVLNVTAYRIGIASSIPVAWIGATAVICAALGGGLVCCGSFVISAITTAISIEIFKNGSGSGSDGISVANASLTPNSSVY